MRARSVARRNIRFVPFKTSVDSFGRYRVYSSKPLTIPDINCKFSDFSDYSLSPETADDIPTNISLRNAIAPRPNISVFYFLYWFWKRSNKSIANCEELRSNVILHPDINPHELAGINLKAIDKKLVLAARSTQVGGIGGPQVFATLDGWTKRSVSVQVPLLGRNGAAHTTLGECISVPGMSEF